MVSVTINDFDFEIKENISILEACKYIGILIPRFCYHEMLSISGNCRMCLVELENVEKPVESCLKEIEDGMTIFIDSPFVKKARETVIESLLLNHPLDCPICDQAGECDLQDQAKSFGSDYSRFFFNKRGVEDKNCGPLIKTVMTRCIHCTRCVRFSSEIAGVDFLGTFARGSSTEIGTYVSDKFFQSEISGNVIDLCPVGALTSKPYAFKARPWELRLTHTVDLLDSTGSSIYVNFKESEISRIIPKSNQLINQSIISDKARFSYDFVKTNRIKNLYKKNKEETLFSITDWSEFLYSLEQRLGKENIVFLISEETDLQTLLLLKKASNKFLNKVKVVNISKTSNKDNTFFNGLNASICDIDDSSSCYIVSLNPKIESSILNARIKQKFKNSILNVYTLGLSFNYNVPSTFLNLNIKKILNVWKSKSLLSINILKDKNPLFIISENIGRRISSFQSLLQFIQNRKKGIKILYVSNFCNTEGVNMLNINGISSSNLNKNKLTFVAIDLDDTLLTRRILNKKTNLIWLNAYGSFLASKASQIAPTCTYFESEGIYLNLEQRAQKTQKVFNFLFNSRSTLNFVASLFNTTKKMPTSFDFLEETLTFPEKLKFLSNSFLKTLSFSNNEHILISKYPIKAYAEDFYCSNKWTKNSNVMQNCSKEIRSISTNFIF